MRPCAAWGWGWPVCWCDACCCAAAGVLAAVCGCCCCCWCPGAVTGCVWARPAAGGTLRGSAVVDELRMYTLLCLPAAPGLRPAGCTLTAAEAAAGLGGALPATLAPGKLLQSCCCCSRVHCSLGKRLCPCIEILVGAFGNQIASTAPGIMHLRGGTRTGTWQHENLQSHGQQCVCTAKRGKHCQRT